MDLLLASAPDRDRWMSVARQAYATVDQRLNHRFPLEWQELDEIWRDLSAEQRLAAWRWPDAAVDDALLAALSEAPSRAEWPRTLTMLPTSLQVALLHNLTVDLLRTTGMSPNLVRLVLSARFTPGLAAQAMLDRHDPAAEGMRYADHVQWFAHQLDALLLPELAREILIGERSLLLAAEMENKPLHAWYRSAWGAAFCRAVITIGPESPPTSLRQAWGLLPEGAQVLWSTELARLFGDRYGHLPEVVERESDWLRQAGELPDKAAVLLMIRRHPDWLREMNAFHYDRALAGLPELLTAIHGSAYSGTINLALVNQLNQERPQFSNPRFPWPRLAEEAKIAEAVPPIMKKTVTEQLSYNRPGRPSARTWGESEARLVYQSLLTMGARLPTQHKQFYATLARLYALNRGVLQDPEEATAFPRMLTPDPVRQPTR